MRKIFSKIPEDVIKQTKVSDFIKNMFELKFTTWSTHQFTTAVIEGFSQPSSYDHRCEVFLQFVCCIYYQKYLDDIGYRRFRSNAHGKVNTAILPYMINKACDLFKNIDNSFGALIRSVHQFVKTL